MFLLFVTKIMPFSKISINSQEIFVKEQKCLCLFFFTDNLHVLYVLMNFDVLYTLLRQQPNNTFNLENTSRSTLPIFNNTKTCLH